MRNALPLGTPSFCWEDFSAHVSNAREIWNGVKCPGTKSTYSCNGVYVHLVTGHPKSQFDDRLCGHVIGFGAAFFWGHSGEMRGGVVN